MLVDPRGCQGSCMPLHSSIFCSPHLNDFVRMRYHGIRWHRLLCGASSFFLLKIGTLLTPFARSQ